MTACAIDDCERPKKTRGYCSMHYHRLQRHGDPLAGGTPQGALSRYFRDVVVPYEGDDCLIWPFTRVAEGYGQMRRDGRRHRVHRLVCEEVHGLPASPEFVAAHSCGNGHLGWVSPRHVSWKTHQGNVLDAIDHGTFARGERHGAASNLTEHPMSDLIAKTNVAADWRMSWMRLQGQLLNRRKAIGMTQDALADRLNVGRATMQRWEGGRVIPPAMGLFRWAAALDVFITSEIASGEGITCDASGASK